MQAVEEPLRITQKGVDIHQCIAKLNSLLPPEPRKPVPTRKSLTNSQSRTPAEALKYRTRRLRDSFPHDRDNDRRRLTSNSHDQWPDHLSRHGESSVEPSAPSKVPSQPATKAILGGGRKIKPSPPKTEEADGIIGDGRSVRNHDLTNGIKHSHRGHQRSSRRVERAARFAQDTRGRCNATKVRVEGNPGSGDGFNRNREQMRERRKLRRMRPSGGDFDKVGNHFERENHAFDPVTRPDSVREAVGSPGADGHEDSSSFHTPNETLDQSHSANSSPCSNFRRDLDPPPLSLDFHASEGDQMSGIGQPPLQTPIDKVVGAESCAIRQPSSRVDPLELPDAVGSGSVSPIAERSRDQGPRQKLSYTIRTERLNAPEDALERRKEEQKDEWERLLQLSKTVQYILHRK